MYSSSLEITSRFFGRVNLRRRGYVLDECRVRAWIILHDVVSQYDTTCVFLQLRFQLRALYGDISLPSDVTNSLFWFFCVCSMSSWLLYELSFIRYWQVILNLSHSLSAVTFIFRNLHRTGHTNWFARRIRMFHRSLGAISNVMFHDLCDPSSLMRFVCRFVGFKDVLIIRLSLFHDIWVKGVSLRMLVASLSLL